MAFFHGPSTETHDSHHIPPLPVMTETKFSLIASIIPSFFKDQYYGGLMNRTVPHFLKTVMTLFLVTLGLCAIPVAGMEENILTTAADDTAIHPGAGEYHSRWNTEVLTNNVSFDYPGTCWGTHILASATGPGDVLYLAYYDTHREGLLLVRVENGKTTSEEMVSSAHTCGVSLDINPVTGAPAVSYRAMDSTLVFAYKKDGAWVFETVDPDITEGYSTSLAFDKAGTPHLAYDDGSSFSNLMYGTRNPNGTWTSEIADHGIGYHLGDAGKNPQLKITDAGAYVAHGDGFLFESLRFSWKPTGNDWKSVTVDRGWGGTGATDITGLTGVFPTFTMGPDGIATIIYYDAMNQTLMKARGPLANDVFKTSVLEGTDRKKIDGMFPVLVNKDSADGGLTGGHLAYVGYDDGPNERSMLMYSEISADPTIPPTREFIDYYPTVSTMTSDSAGKPHIFYLDSKHRQLKYAWRV
jgi:hypothetical protein